MRSNFNSPSISEVRFRIASFVWVANIHPFQRTDFRSMDPSKLPERRGLTEISPHRQGAGSIQVPRDSNIVRHVSAEDRP